MTGWEEEIPVTRGDEGGVGRRNDTAANKGRIGESGDCGELKTGKKMIICFKTVAVLIVWGFFDRKIKRIKESTIVRYPHAMLTERFHQYLQLSSISVVFMEGQLDQQR